MTRFLVLDWDHQQLNIVLASLRYGKVRVSRAISLAEGQSPNPAEAEELGRLLRERLKTAGMPAAPLLVCVGRDRVILKEVRHPPVPPAEEAAVVHFQVMKELTDPPDEVVIDYTPASEVEANGERRALALIMRRELLKTYETLARAAGLKLAGICPRPFGTGACLKHLQDTGLVAPAPSGGVVGILTVGKSWAEFCVFRGGNLLFARSLAAGPTLPQEVRRNLAVFSGQSSQQPVRTVYVTAGTEQAALCDRLRELVAVPVHPFDPFAGAERPELLPLERGAFSGSVGLLHALAERRSLPINFASPRQPQKASDPNRRRLVLAAAAVAVCLLGAVTYCYARLDARDRELAALVEEQTDRERELAKLDEDSKRVKALDEWTQADVVWLDELYDLTDRFPDPTSLRLTQLTADPMTRTGKSPHVARLMLKGIMTADYQPVNKLETQLVNDGHYRVEPKVVGRNTGTDRMRFPQQFTTRVEIEKLPPEKYVRRLSNQPAGNEPRKGRGPGGNSPPDFGADGFGGFPGGQP